MSNALPLKWKSRCGRYTVSISDSCFTKTLEMARKHCPDEVGTSLVGCYSDDGFDAFISDMAPVCSDSKSLDNSFWRGIKGLQTLFVELRKSYAGKRYYVGEWHSHPDASPIPSRTDDMTQSAIAADRQANCPESILVVIAGNLFGAPDLRVFVYSRKRGRVDLLCDET